MHPSVHSHDPDAKCPICGWILCRSKRPGPKPSLRQGTPRQPAGHRPQPHEFTIPLDRQQMIGVTYATVETKPLRRTIRAVGLVAATTAKHWDYVARVDGYVHNLEVAAPGDRVEKGQVLMDLYSPDLVRRRTNTSTSCACATTAAASRTRPRSKAPSACSPAQGPGFSSGISPTRRSTRSGRRDGRRVSPLKSPFDGVVEEVAVHQGRHVSVGDHLVDLVDLSSVWVWAEFYENELPLLKTGLPVLITSSAIPGPVRFPAGSRWSIRS
jgi:Cu(I)/Ag(I) efflux system membrane fusion protein